MNPSTNPRIRVTVSGFMGADRIAGPEEHIDDPDLGLLHELLGNVEEGRLLYVIANRVGDGADEQTFLQVARGNEGLLVGHRLGVAAPYVEAETHDRQLVQEVLTSWVLGHDNWQDRLHWRPVDVTPGQKIRQPKNRRRWFRKE